MKPAYTLQAQQLVLEIGNKSICQNLDLNTAPGEIWGILGQNGSGKSTFLHTLGGLHQAQQGDIYIEKRKLSQYPSKQRAQIIGLLFQDSQANFPQTVWEYCLAGRYPHFLSFLETQSDREAALAALEIMQLDQQRDQNILSLSGGEWRRLTMATLLAQNPSIYLLDEPLNHLDLRHQRRLLNYFQSRARHEKITVLMALHDINVAEQYCDHILMFFGEGETLAGGKDILTEANLTRLYGHTIHAHATEQGKWWIAI